MENLINTETCKNCGICIEICPAKIIKTNNDNSTIFDPERVDLCYKCGHCMAICNTKSIQINGLTYENDFYDLLPFFSSLLKKICHNSLLFVI